jgi:hypothetical protein
VQQRLWRNGIFEFRDHFKKGSGQRCKLEFKPGKRRIALAEIQQTESFSGIVSASRLEAGGRDLAHEVA